MSLFCLRFFIDYSNKYLPILQEDTLVSSFKSYFLGSIHRITKFQFLSFQFHGSLTVVTNKTHSLTKKFILEVIFYVLIILFIVICPEIRGVARGVPSKGKMAVAHPVRNRWHIPSAEELIFFSFKKLDFSLSCRLKFPIFRLQRLSAPLVNVFKNFYYFDAKGKPEQENIQCLTNTNLR